MPWSSAALDDAQLACSCVSDLVRKRLCALCPTHYDGLLRSEDPGDIPRAVFQAGTQIGDTGGYSLRVAYSANKGVPQSLLTLAEGCGGAGTAGSASQRAALLLADGPGRVTQLRPKRKETLPRGYSSPVTLSQIFPSSSPGLGCGGVADAVVGRNARLVRIW
jgi:hypothetical protein